MKIGDLVKNLHDLYFAETGIIIEISKPQLSNPNACPYRVHWFDREHLRASALWMREDWLEKL